MRTCTFGMSLAVASLFVSASISQAAPIAVLNYSFEADVVAEGTPLVAAPAGWTGTRLVANDFSIVNSVDADFAGTTGANLPAPAHGANFLRIDTNDTALQLTTATHQILNAGEVYTLTIAGATVDGPGAYYSAFWVNANPSIYLDEVGSENSGRVFTLATGLTVGSFTDFSITYTTVSTDIGQYISPFIYSNFPTFYVDNVRLDGPAVPEPTTLSLLGLGAMALLGRRRQ